MVTGCVCVFASMFVCLCAYSLGIFVCVHGYGCVCVQDVEVKMFSDVERLKNILSELGDTISQPNTLPVTTKDFIEVCMCVHMYVSLYVHVFVCMHVILYVSVCISRPSGNL